MDSGIFDKVVEADEHLARAQATVIWAWDECDLDAERELLCAAHGFVEWARTKLAAVTRPAEPKKESSDDTRKNEGADGAIGRAV
jgi:hypothetical protein